MRLDRRLVSGVVLRHAAVCLAVAALALLALTLGLGSLDTV